MSPLKDKEKEESSKKEESGKPKKNRQEGLGVNPKTKKLVAVLLTCTLDDTKLGSELGGVTLKKHDVLAIRVDMAGRVLTHYNPRFRESGREEVDKLANGTHEVRPYKAPQASSKDSETTSKEGQANDKSMGTQSGKPKKR